jgi:hypothetical protein
MGWLEKRSAIVRKWRRRWCVYAPAGACGGPVLRCYRQPPPADAVGFVDLAAAPALPVRFSAPERGFCLGLPLRTGGEVVIAATSAEAQLRWLRAIARALPRAVPDSLSLTALDPSIAAAEPRSEMAGDEVCISYGQSEMLGVLDVCIVGFFSASRWHPRRLSLALPTLHTLRPHCSPLLHLSIPEPCSPTASPSPACGTSPVAPTSRNSTSQPGSPSPADRWWPFSDPSAPLEIPLRTAIVSMAAGGVGGVGGVGAPPFALMVEDMAARGSCVLLGLPSAERQSTLLARLVAAAREVNEESAMLPWAEDAALQISREGRASLSPSLPQR